MAVVLAIENVTHRYRRRGGSEVCALRSVSLCVNAGACAAIRGPSGSGKTTLLLAAGGLLAPERGRVSVMGTSLYGLSPEDRAGYRARSVGFVFQQFHLIPYLSVLENILTPSLAVRDDGLRSRAEDLVRSVGLESRRDHPPSELSTGERQRTALARALLLRPPLLLADEPTGNLDDRNASAVADCLRAYAREGGAVLIATHDARIFADWTVEIEEGAIRVAGDGA